MEEEIDSHLLPSAASATDTLFAVDLVMSVDYDFSLLANPRFVTTQWIVPHPRPARMERRAVCARIPRVRGIHVPCRDVFSAQ
jgi:hypothetical protein